ncbi:MAG: hypothetical protein PWP23_2906 [Candidatus Sumerlaeota bacterium]|nr:hypothetical protein [Candidatus Sumerlaeota bacterium]
MPVGHFIVSCPEAGFFEVNFASNLDILLRQGAPVMKTDRGLVDRYGIGLLEEHPEFTPEIVSLLEKELLWCEQPGDKDEELHFANIRFLSEVLMQQGEWTEILGEVLASDSQCGSTPRLLVLATIRKTRSECEEVNALVLNYLMRLRDKPVESGQTLEVGNALETMWYLRDRPWMQEFLRDLVVRNPGAFYPSLKSVAAMISPENARDFSPERRELQKAVEKLDAVTEQLDWTRESQLRR